MTGEPVEVVATSIVDTPHPSYVFTPEGIEAWWRGWHRAVEARNQGAIDRAAYVPGVIPESSKVHFGPRAT